MPEPVGPTGYKYQPYTAEGMTDYIADRPWLAGTLLAGGTAGALAGTIKGHEAVNDMRESTYTTPVRPLDQISGGLPNPEPVADFYDEHVIELPVDIPHRNLRSLRGATDERFPGERPAITATQPFMQPVHVDELNEALKRGKRTKRVNGVVHEQDPVSGDWTPVDRDRSAVAKFWLDALGR
jgi:hypothetical protein